MIPYRAFAEHECGNVLALLWWVFFCFWVIYSCLVKQGFFLAECPAQPEQ
jgi:hypothetical protein